MLPQDRMIRCRTRAWPPSARSGLASTSGSLTPLLLEARPDLIRRRLDLGREDQHHVEEIGELADRPLAALAAQRRGGLARLLDQLRVERFAVHVREHQHRARGGVLHDRRDQTALVEPDLGRHVASPLGRTFTPRRPSSSFNAATAISPEWKIDAARPASAPVRLNSSTKSVAVPAPPDAITGTRTASATRAVRSSSKPSRVPSRSIDVSRISPAPASTPRRAHSTASSPVGVRPPST